MQIQVDLERYRRQLLIEAIGKSGQQKLFDAKVLVCGAGGLGGPALTYLAAAGVGNIGLCDFDVIEPSNLNRQILYNCKDIKKSKAHIAKKKLKKFNPDVKIKIYPEKLTEENISDILKNYDVVIDAVDNFKSRYLINRAAYKSFIPLVCGAVCELEGILTVIIPKENTSCLQCIYPIKPSTELTSKVFGILGAIAGIIGSLQALETIKFILGLQHHCLKNKILIFNGIENTYRIRTTSKRKNCPVCR
ncbi:MAG: HesA/MoeB/ThiF family protein [Endomicrobium sp.]|jgi:adenylyltransferase/sulfurtransferase|nr:HesA/MoeB/ThiF family protein [Endomicrobium sp.]